MSDLVRKRLRRAARHRRASVWFLQTASRSTIGRLRALQLILERKVLPCSIMLPGHRRSVTQ